jgi:hypothetical protein
MAAALLAGCGHEAYRPATPASVDAVVASLDLETIDRGSGPAIVLADGVLADGGLAVRVRWRANAEATAIARAFLVPPEAAPCTAGLEAAAIDVDGQTRWDRPVGLGRQHVVTMGFPYDERLLAGPLVVDVEVTGPLGTSCVRLPVTGGAQRFVARSNIVWGAAAGAVAPLWKHGGAALVFDGVVGRWVGPLRLTVRAGLTVGTNTLNVGGDDDAGGSTPTFIDIHVAPELTVVPFVRRTFAVGLSASYVFGSGTYGDGTASDPYHDVDFSGPRLAIVLADVQLAPLGAPTHRPRDGLGLELSLLRANGWSVGPAGPVYVFGVGGLLW